MPVVICPSCKAKLKAPDQLIGKSVKCPGCATPVLVKADAGTPAPAPAPRPAPKPQAVAAAPAKKKPPVEEIEDIEDFEDIEDLDDAPPKKKGGAAVAKKPAPAADDDFADLGGDDDDDAPKKGKGKAKGKAKKLPPGVGGTVSEEDKSNAFLMYILVILLGPVGLIYWIMKRGESRFVDYHGKQMINYSITMFVYSLLLMVFLSLGIGAGFMIHWAAGLILGGLVFLVAMALQVFSLITVIRGLLKAKNGEWFQFPLAWQMLK